MDSVHSDVPLTEDIDEGATYAVSSYGHVSLCQDRNRFLNSSGWAGYECGLPFMKPSFIIMKNTTILKLEI